MERNRWIKLWIGVMVGLIWIVSGCAQKKEYTYSGITGSYEALLCNLAPLDDQASRKEKCILDEAVGLEDVVRIALANNPDKMMAVSRVKKAQARLELAQAAFFPYIGVYTEYINGDAPSAFLFKKIDQGELPPQTNFNDPGTIENYELGVKGQLNLFNGGRDILNREMAEIGVDISQLDRQQIENSLVSTAISAYYDALAVKEFIAIAQESVSTVETQLKMMRVRFQAGAVLKSDILSLEVRLAQAKEEVVRTQNGYKMALTALANILGVAPDRDVQLKKSDMKPRNLPYTYDQGMVYGLKHRPEIRKVREQVRQARMALDVARSEYLPRVDLQSKYYIDSPDIDLDVERENWTIGVLLNWDVFTGFSTMAKIRQAYAALEEILSGDRKALLGVKMDIKNAYLKLEEAKARLEVTETSVAQSEESLQLVKKQYEEGAATITRYLEAELDRNRARIRSTAAFFDHEKALADIGRAIGYWIDNAPTAPAQQ